MRRLFAVLALLSIFSLCSAAIDTPYTVGTWRGFCPAAVSWTFDDGLLHQYSNAMPLFDAKGFKMTFYTVVTGGMFHGWSYDDTAAAHGHEIASHTMTHPNNLGTMTVAQQIFELKNSYDSIVQHLPGQQCLHVAYPNCNSSTDSLTKKYYLSGRICSGQVNAKSPSDFYRISCFILGSTGSNTTTAAINTLANNALSSNGWTVYLVHEVDSGSGYSPTKSTAIQGSLAYLDSNRAKFWVETYGNVFRYIKERNAASVKVQSTATDSIVLSVTDTLTDSIFNFPISIRRPLPADWQYISVKQGGAAVPVVYKDSNSVRYATFDVVPDKGSVVLKPSATAVAYVSSHNPAQNGFAVRLTRTGLSFAVPASAGPDLSIALYGLNGVRLAGFRRHVTPGQWASVSLPEQLRHHGLFIVKVTDGRSVWSRQEVRN